MVAAPYLQVAQGGAIGERLATPLTLIQQREPFSTAYVMLVLLYLFFVKSPICAVLYAVPSMRPLSNWSWTEAMILGALRELLRASSSLKLFDRIDLEGEQESTFKATVLGTPVWIPKLAKPLTGELGKMMEETGDRSVRLSAWWYSSNGIDHSQRPDGKDKKCILFFHGGAYIMGTATPRSHNVGILRTLLASNAKLSSHDDSVPLKGLAVEYRLSNRASLPGIVADAVAGWRYLVEDCGYLPGNVIVSGDSAGGHLALALTRYLISEKPFGDSVPKGLVLYSPWIDLSLSYVYACEDLYSHDYLGTSAMEYTVREVLRGTSPDAALSLYTSSVSLARPNTRTDFESFPPAIVSVGSVEKLITENKALAQHYSDAGSNLELHVDEGAYHNVYTLPVGFQTARKSAAERNTRWLMRLWT